MDDNLDNNFIFCTYNGVNKGFIQMIDKKQNEIIKVVSEKITYKLKCQKCPTTITGTSEKHVLSNLRSHLALKCNDAQSIIDDVSKEEEK